MGSVRTITRGGSRFYVDPETHEKVPGVTSIVDMLNKPFLQYWAAKLVAEHAVDNLAAVASIAERDRDGAVDFLKGAPHRYTKLRAEVGSKAHDLFERMMRGEHVGRVEPDLVPYARHFAEFMTAVNPELVRAEDVVWSDSHAYAGSFDALLRVWLDEDRRPTPDRSGEPCLVIVDYKTSKAVYPTVALQLAAYAHGDRIVDPEGHVEPMPDVDGGAVLHITDEAWNFLPVRVDEDVFSVFLALRQAFTWDRETSREVIGRSLASGGRLVTGTQRRAM